MGYLKHSNEKISNKRKERTMKRIIILTLFTVFLLSSLLLASCEINDVLHNHDFGEWETVKEATCIENGSRARNCSCGESETEVIYAMGHTEETIESTPATCTESGLTEGKKCSACGEVLVKQETVTALGHDFYYHEPTDENGNTVTVAVCQREDCGEVQENPAGLYDADNKLLASWDELVNIYGLDVEAYYSNGDYEKKGTHITYILNNNKELKSATKLIVDNSVTKIGRLAFEHCTSLVNIELPDTLISIYDNAFNYCESLKSIAIPEGIKCSVNELFQYCTSLEYIYLPASTLEADYYFEVFIGCPSIKSIEISEDSLYFKTVDGNLYSKDGKCFIKYATGKEDKEFTLPEGVMEIGEGAFSYSSYLTTIYLHNNITTVYGRPFSKSLSIDDVYYNGTEEEWEALNIHFLNYSHDVLYHYDGITRFMTFRFTGGFGSGGVSSLVHFKIDGGKLYVYQYSRNVWDLYSEITKVEDLKIEYMDFIYDFYDYEDKDAGLQIIERIQSLGEWYVINGEEKLITRILCYFDGVLYQLEVKDMNEETNTVTIIRITYAIVNLDDYYEN